MEAIDNTLTIDQRPIFNNSIQKENLISIFPTSGSNLNENGEINFVIETCDQYLLTKGTLTKLDGNRLKKAEYDETTGKLKAAADQVTLTNNAPMFLFDRITYSLNGDQIENVRDPGRASLMKGILKMENYHFAFH
ncbi:hypothetical protein M3Y97_01157200 [Aphelenchoides bicaudatus]|nr:hypothetical protein M3Y97_01157200 [Aphelenchoides bicaudatus]